MDFKQDIEYLKTEKILLTVSTSNHQYIGVIHAYNDTHVMLVQSQQSYSDFERCYIEAGVKSLIPINKIESIVYQFKKQVS